MIRNTKNLDITTQSKNPVISSRVNDYNRHMVYSLPTNSSTTSLSTTDTSTPPIVGLMTKPEENKPYKPPRDYGPDMFTPASKITSTTTDLSTNNEDYEPFEIATEKTIWEDNPEIREENIYPGVNYVAPNLVFGTQYPEPTSKPEEYYEGYMLYTVLENTKHRSSRLPGIPLKSTTAIIGTYHTNAICGEDFETLVQVLNRGLKNDEYSLEYNIRDVKEQLFDCAFLRKHEADNPSEYILNNLDRPIIKYQIKNHEEIYKWMSNCYNVIQQLGSAALGASFSLGKGKHTMYLENYTDTIKITPDGITTLKARDAPNGKNKGGRRRNKTIRKSRKQRKTRKQLKK